MEPEEYTRLYHVEQDHWWYKGMRQIIFPLLEKYITRKSNTILDIGCGTGMNMRHLKQYGKVIGTDTSDLALRFAQERRCTVTKASVVRLPFQAQSFDLVTCFDVINSNSIRDDVRALKEIHRVLRPRGIFLIREPAFKVLWSGHDIVGHTARRYTLRELRTKLTKAGFRIERITYLNTLLFPAVAVSRLLKNIFGKCESDFKRTPRMLNELLFRILSSESSLLTRINLPFGVSVLAIARKVDS